MNLPKHIELSIVHNPHRGDYETIERWLDLNEHRDGAEISDEERAEILRTGELWVVRWYPDTPVGWCAVAAATLERALAAAGAQPRRPAPAAIHLRATLLAAIPVVEAAIGIAELEDGPPSNLLAAVRAFGGGGPEGIERASGHLVEMRELADIAMQLCDGLGEALDAWASVRDDSEPNWPTHPETQARIAELRTLIGGV